MDMEAWPDRLQAAVYNNHNALPKPTQQPLQDTCLTNLIFTRIFSYYSEQILLEMLLQKSQLKKKL